MRTANRKETDRVTITRVASIISNMTHVYDLRVLNNVVDAFSLAVYESGCDNDNITITEQQNGAYNTSPPKKIFVCFREKRVKLYCFDLFNT